MLCDLGNSLLLLVLLLLLRLEYDLADSLDPDLDRPGGVRLLLLPLVGRSGDRPLLGDGDRVRPLSFDLDLPKPKRFPMLLLFGGGLLPLKYELRDEIDVVSGSLLLS